MLENKMVSIVIATYNSEKTLMRALNSVLNQSFQDWECIVVDGASKDGTIDIVKEFVSKDSRFRMFQSQIRVSMMPSIRAGKWRKVNG